MGLSKLCNQPEILRLRFHIGTDLGYCRLEIAATMTASTVMIQVPHNGRWLGPVELQAFRAGWIAAITGKSRVWPRGPFSYNQRAAFVDGWDTFHEQGRTRKRSPRSG